MHSNKSYVQVVVDLPRKEVDRLFDYSIPPQFQSKLSLGSTVLVPFGSTEKVGYVVSFTNRPAVAEVSPIKQVLDEKPAFDKEIRSLCQWIAKYYLSTFSQALKLALPPGPKRRLIQKVELTGEFNQQNLERFTPPAAGQVALRLREVGGKASLSALKKFFGSSLPSLLTQLERKGVVKKSYQVAPPQVAIKLEQVVRLKGSTEKIKSLLDNFGRAPKQRKILSILLQNRSLAVAQLLGAAEASYSSLKSLKRKGLVAITKEKVERRPESMYTEEFCPPWPLTAEQEEALQLIIDSLQNNKSRVFLLQGVTGSGKTEVYLQAIAENLKLGKTSIVLVPEIALTPQIVHRFKQRFGETVALLHSGLSLGERFDQWQAVSRGKYRVVVGARSAIFAPVQNLGLVIVDEEHESTYKQNRHPCYHAREVALKRAKLSGATVILGSATPAIETRFKAGRGAYQLVALTKRIKDRELPAVQLVDMRSEVKKDRKSVFSSLLQNEIEAALNRGGKAILFLNRRGYSSFLLCQDCGLTIKCPRCAVSLTYHQVEKSLKCHHCDYSQPAPHVCPGCQSFRIGYFGIGTQRVESELKHLFPETALIRMDTDSTTTRGAHQVKLTEFKRRERAILLGTQMVAKGLDFPEVTLVGVINADTALNLPDFRSGERTFQLLMQVSGRAGRGESPGKVIIQTYCPEHYAIQSLSQGDYDNFYEKEVKLREELDYPPLVELINMIISGRSQLDVEKAAVYLRRLLSQAKGVGLKSVLGPAPAPLPKLKNIHRWHVLLKASESEKVKEFLEENYFKLLPSGYKDKVSLSIDVDPVSVL